MWNGKQAKLMLIMLKISGEAFPLIAPGSCLNCIAIFIHYSAFWFWFRQLTTVSFQKTVTWRCSRRSFDSKTRRLSRKLSKDVPVIESFFMLALIHQLEKEWEENTRLQSSGREEKVWNPDSRFAGESPASGVGIYTNEQLPITIGRRCCFKTGCLPNPGRFVPEM